MDVTPFPSPFVNLAEAVAHVLKHLQAETGLGLWMFTRTVGNDWIVLHAADQSYNIQAGDVFSWSDSFCIRMVNREGPSVAPDAAAIPAYVDAPIAQQLPIGAYMGVPLLSTNGSLFGTLCAIDPHVQPQKLSDWLPSVQLYARLLSTILQDELRHQDQERHLERAQNDAQSDALTALLNRRGWEAHLTLEEDRCLRYGNPAAVIMLDLDDLKRTNDTYGHVAGDELIMATAQVLRQSLRSVDIVARLGGDEFAVLVVDSVTDGIPELRQRIDKALAANDIHASIGWAMRDPRATLLAAQAQADTNMYEIKRQRKAARQRQDS